MKRNLFCMLCIALSLAVLSPLCASASHLYSDEAQPVWSSVSAQSYCLMDADTLDVLIQSNADVRLPMASTTKIMTCIVALEEGDVNSEVLIPQEAVGIEGSSIYLTKGERLTLLELLYGLMLESANDAAVAIACHVSGSVPAFAERMNAKAAELELFNTHFCNPNGLQEDGHYSCARDLSLLMCYAMQNEMFAEISSTQTKTIPAPNGKNRFLSNHNRLLRSYEECIAGKTGYTKTAGRCLVTAAERDGKTLVCTTLGDPDDWRDHKALFDDGFSLYQTRSLLESSGFHAAVPVVGGEMEEVSVLNLESFTRALRAEESVETVIELPPFLYAPVLKGDIVGSAVFMQNGKEIGRISLYAQDGCERKEIELSFWQKIWNKICEWFDKIWKK